MGVGIIVKQGNRMQRAPGTLGSAYYTSFSWIFWNTYLYKVKKLNNAKENVCRIAFWQMEPPSPLISWVNPFPSRFINRTACFPRKVSYFRESRMSPWKNKVGWSRTQKPVRRPFSFFTIRPFLRCYSRWDLAIIKQKLLNYPMIEHEAMGQRQQTEDHGKVIFASVLFFFFFCRHTSHI